VSGRKPLRINEARHWLLISYSIFPLSGTWLDIGDRQEIAGAAI
jgi:hypothetical protein